MKAKDRTIRVTVEYARASETRVDFAITMNSDGESGGVPSPIKGDSLYLEANTKKTNP